MAPPIRIAMLNADVPVPNVLATRGSSYGTIFHDLLTAAAGRLRRRRHRRCRSDGSTTANNNLEVEVEVEVEIKSTDYHVPKLEYPVSVADEVDVVLITGSAAAAYDDLEWVRRLEGFVWDVYVNHPRVKIFGSCFGHQIICRSLLSKGCGGVVVERDPKGWELGVRRVQLSEEFRKSPLGRGLSTSSEGLRLQFVHADHVRVSLLDALPREWVVVGSTEHCAIQGVYRPGRVLMYQGHFEFDRFVNMEVLKVFGAAWDPLVLQEALEACDADDDAEAAAELVVQFLMEASDVKEPATREVVGGLLTPPLVE